ncbi:MAG: L-2-hydroxyglutarate oxidase [Deltaproteobacteria bacterium]|nr:L-2-hydroxyglutarate oxidase [Deltaproteobacteria bacterium]
MPQTSERTVDVAIVGGGIVGLATALRLCHSPGTTVAVLEAEPRLATHQTGHNSGVVHSGLYYRPGSLKARLCTEGREALIRFCEAEGIACDRCGKVVAATRPEEMPALEILERRGTANGLEGLRRLTPEGVRALEPHVAALAGLRVEESAILDYGEVCEAFARIVRRAGHAIRTDARVTAIHRETGRLVLETTSGEVKARTLVNCAGLHSDRVARLAGVDPGLRILPFRGEYYELVPERQHLVNHLVYPVPDLAFPFLGVHFTRRIRGGVEAGPNAVLAFRREGYSRFSVSLPDLVGYLAFPGFWRMARKHWRMGAREMARSFSKALFVRALRGLVPEIRPEDVLRAQAGVRAQALAPDGALVDDFRIVEGDRTMHVLNAPSPAATASLAIGRVIASRAACAFGLPAPEPAAWDAPVVGER